ncbi:oxidoreductase [Paucilactobacillus nenjiangensis]|uniref:oxidoreductase n=1 Tax=Paucilactobacillus nenjiangensis TaxID=1296540 RepID=UPI003FA29F42
MGVNSNSQIPSLSRLAEAMKKDNGKAILQRAHGGRESAYSQNNDYQAIAPSKMDFPWLDYDVKEITNDDINKIIDDFATATQRAIDAGFDGVEIHNGNHDLLQQFFSAFSNQRIDKWGGSLSNRMELPLAVLKAIRAVIDDNKQADFILGWRISHEEIHGENIGYKVDEMLAQAKKTVEIGIDYLNVSLTGLQYNYAAMPQGYNESFAELFDKISGESPVFIGSQIHTVADGMAALDNAEGVYIAREALIDPEFTAKVIDKKEDEIVTTMTFERLKEIGLSDGLLKTYATLTDWAKSIPLKGLKY